MKKEILLETTRNGYSTSQCGETLTVSELIDILQDYDSDTPVYFSNDNGYTYGNLTWDTIQEKDAEDDDEEEM